VLDEKTIIDSDGIQHCPKKVPAGRTGGGRAAGVIGIDRNAVHVDPRWAATGDRGVDSRGPGVEFCDLEVARR